MGFRSGQVRTWGLVALGIAGALTLAACGGGSDVSATGGGGAPLSEAEFAERADRICAEVASHFDELPDPDGEGGAKPIGLGGFMRDWVAQLRELDPPPAVADDWKAGLALLVRAANKLDDAEAGDRNAEGEALWGLEPRAQRHFDAMHVPFRACFVE